MDHPRSRGVYPSRWTGATPTMGSSPLARGLPDERGSVDYRARIIPARAGFTGRNSDTPARPADHPRSRGVYACPAQQPREEDGSSPLARGLLGVQSVPGVIVGIIPARAGFTLHDLDGRARARDHPRSRGVYPEARLGPASLVGSSPLARGLPSREERREHHAGIIPARAGFTYETSHRADG